ncbi:hypothetical protein WQO_16930 [Streptomyces globisporus C-1027]|uniref:Transcription regulator PadR N-terminal domain-containing protein n=1 Tax=Streptomyces globisporus C-1027 TaxID=1172567 RepID=A0A0U3ME34_STRGL|nr:hypothetical protein WQO_16930 [Streptomyces globisporus C-1027]
MSIRHGLLALLERGPRYGSQLRTEFESRTGSTWPLNVGQVYTTLQCLVVALTGVLLGTAAGLVPAVALRLTDLRAALEKMREDPMQSAYTPIVMPWETVGLLALVVPVLAGLLAAALTSSRLTLARRAG